MSSKLEAAKADLYSVQDSIKKLENNLQQQHLQAIFLQGQIAAYTEIEKDQEAKGAEAPSTDTQSEEKE